MKKNPKTVAALKMRTQNERKKKITKALDPWRVAAWKKQKEDRAKRVRRQQAAAHKRALARKNKSS